MQITQLLKRWRKTGDLTARREAANLLNAEIFQIALHFSGYNKDLAKDWTQDCMLEKFVKGNRNPLLLAPDNHPSPIGFRRNVVRYFMTDRLRAYKRKQKREIFVIPFEQETKEEAFERISKVSSYEQEEDLINEIFQKQCLEKIDSILKTIKPLRYRLSLMLLFDFHVQPTIVEWSKEPRWANHPNFILQKSGDAQKILDEPSLEQKKILSCAFFYDTAENAMESYRKLYERALSKLKKIVQGERKQ